MRVAVITPYYQEDLNTLSRCHNSVRDQTYTEVSHYMIADGHPRDYVQSWDVEHIILPICQDTGDTPRLVGSAVAVMRGADAILFLDADCWLEPTHVENMVKAMQSSGAAVVTCPRNLYRLDGTFMAVDTESDGRAFNDTNCYLIGKPAFSVLHSWGFKDRMQSLVGDRYFWRAVTDSGCDIARIGVAGVNYTTTYAFHFQQNGEAVPSHAKVLADIGEGLRFYIYEHYQEKTL